MSFPGYDNLRYGVGEWFGQVPGHWKLATLKRVVDPFRPITYGIVQAGPNIEGGVPYIRPADMTDENGVASDDDILKTSDEIAESYSRSTIRTGDLVCSIGPSFGKVMVTPQSLDGANLTQGTARVAIHAPNDPRFFFWVLRSHSSFSQWESSVGGATFRALNLGPLAATSVLIPPIDEQHAIASFVDRETSKIDTLVSEQRRLVELLKEKRQAVISHAVTKGLDPTVPMKPSGIEWLGDVPAHWTVGKLAYASNRIGDGLHGTPEYVDRSQYHFVNGNNLNDGRIVVTEKTRCVSREEHERHRVELGDDSLLISINGTIGNLALYHGESVVLGKSSAYINCIRSKLNREFLYWYLQSTFMRLYFDYNVTGTTIYNLSLESIRKIPVPLPRLDEQLKIVRNLEARVSEFKSLLTHAELAITLLQERRTALISAAVTGKIDVREIALEGARP